MKFALIGNPLGHTLSPAIHNRLFELAGISASYEAISILPENLAAELPGLFTSYTGFNVTIPHKSAVIPFLSETTGFASLCGAVNTVDCQTRAGYNTDGAGMRLALDAAGLSARGKTAVLGAGGTARTAAFLAVQAGGTVTVIARNIRRAQAIAEDLEKKLKLRIRIEAALPDENFDLLINATPVGMFPKTNESPLAAGALSRVGGVFDAVYNPEETVLLKEARKKNIPAAGGMLMLVGQAAEAQKLWYGAAFEQNDILETAYLSSEHNNFT